MSAREALLETARQLPRPSPASAEEYAARRETLVAAVNERMLAREDLDQLIGPGNRRMMCDNHANHGRFVESLLTRMEPEVLVDSVLWVFHAYRSHGFRETYWSAQLNTWVDLLRETLSPPAFAEIYPLYHWFIIHQPRFFALSRDAGAPGQHAPAPG